MERNGSIRRASSLAGVEDLWNMEEDEDMKSGRETAWKNLSTKKKTFRSLWIISKLLAIIFLLYCFVCSLSLLSSGFRLIGGRSAGQIFQQNELLKNPVAGLMIGVLATVLFQSSSTTTSIIVTMVSAQIINVSHAVYIIMGANIGTSVTNTVVSLFHSSDRNEFRRAFAAATVHDMFNWLSVLVFLPLEVITKAVFGQGYLVFLSERAVGLATRNSSAPTENQDFLKIITKPVTKLLIQLDKNTITEIANGISTNATINKKFCGLGQPCKHLLHDLDDSAAGAVVLVISLIILCLALFLIVKVLHSLLNGSVIKVIGKVVNADFPGCFKHLTGYFGMVVGAVITFLVQSSSIFTSTLTPLVAVGVLSLERAYPLTLGSNIGTTGTALIAAFAVEEDVKESVQISLCHLFFNISGVLLWYPISHCRKVPIKLAKSLGNKTATYRWFAVFYLSLMFLFLPIFVFILSLAGWIPLLCVCVLIFIIVLVVIALNLLQEKHPGFLPEKLRNWDFLPAILRSLEPYDRLINRVKKACCCCCKRPSNEVSPTTDEPRISVYSIVKVESGL